MEVLNVWMPRSRSVRSSPIPMNKYPSRLWAREVVAMRNTSTSRSLSDQERSFESCWMAILDGRARENGLSVSLPAKAAHLLDIRIRQAAPLEQTCLGSI